MIISLIYYVILSKYVDSSFPQCNVLKGVQGGCSPSHLLMDISNCENWLAVWTFSQMVRVFVSQVKGHGFDIHCGNLVKLLH